MRRRPPCKARRRSHLGRGDKLNNDNTGQSGSGDFATEYRYVLGDLKNIGVLAAALFLC
jgi:hypothetical protein